MSDTTHRHEQDSERKRAQSTDFLDTLNSCAIALMITGVCFCVVAFVYPGTGGVTFDATLPAEEMERREQQQRELEEKLQVLQLIGVVFVSAGALVEAAIIMVLVVRGDMLRCCLSATAAASAPGQSEEKLCLSSADELSMQRRSYGADAEETVVFDKSAH